VVHTGSDSLFGADLPNNCTDERFGPKCHGLEKSLSASAVPLARVIREAAREPHLRVYWRTSTPLCCQDGVGQGGVARRGHQKHHNIQCDKVRPGGGASTRNVCCTGTTDQAQRCVGEGSARPQGSAAAAQRARSRGRRPTPPNANPLAYTRRSEECRVKSVCDSDMNVGLAASNDRLLEAICHSDSGGGGEREPGPGPGAGAVAVMDAFAWANEELATTAPSAAHCSKYDDVVHHSVLTVSFVGAWLRDVCGDGVYH